METVTLRPQVENNHSVFFKWVQECESRGFRSRMGNRIDIPTLKENIAEKDIKTGKDKTTVLKIQVPFELLQKEHYSILQKHSSL